jgi:hypothetical protein
MRKEWRVYGCFWRFGAWGWLLLLALVVCCLIFPLFGVVREVEIEGQKSGMLSIETEIG